MNIYVSNLNFSVTDDELRQLFTPFGDVSSAKVIHDRDTGRSRGFGFVEMDNKDEALKAISELNNSEHSGKTINVNEARPKPERSSRPYGNDRGGRGGGGYGSNDRYNKKW